jgi:rRNA maturation endonuclease Nob1
MAADILTWNLLCEACNAQFVLPVPKGPVEEKETHCPVCGSKRIKRLDACCSGAQVPGG